MTKKTFHDIKRPTVVQEEKIPMKVFRPIVEKTPDLGEKTFNDYHSEISTKKPRYTLWIVAVVAVIFLFFALSFLFSSATVSVNPKIKPISLNQSLTATKDASADDLSFDLMTLSGEDSKTISGGEEKDVSESAKGKVVLYNSFNTTPQPLLIDTRLEGSNGKIYKTKTKTTIPGVGKDGTPGKLSVEIYANEPGPDYNSTPLDFKIFGFKNSPKNSKFYGRSVGEIAGGFIGKTKQVSDEEKTKAQNELQTSLETELFIKALSQIPQGFILYKDSTFLNVDESSTKDQTADGSITLNMKATLYGFVINEKKLTDKIIAYLLPDNKDDVYVSNLRDLTFSLSNKESIDFSSVSKIDFDIYGVPKIVYRVDGEKLATDLSGRSKNDFKQILLQYPNIDSAELSIRPIWKSSFPDKLEKIKVIINYPK